MSNGKFNAPSYNDNALRTFSNSSNSKVRDDARTELRLRANARHFNNPREYDKNGNKRKYPL